MKLKSLLVLISFLAAVEIAPESAAKAFLTGTNYPSGEYPSAAVVQDLNNDRIADIVSANSNAANLSVFLGKANGPSPRRSISRPAPGRSSWRALISTATGKPI